MPIVDLVTADNFTIQYDFETRIGYVTYKGRLTSEITAAVYGWLTQSSKTGQSLPLYGGVFDFRQVTDYDADNFATARSKSISFRLEHAESMSAVPIALLVNTIEQEVMVQISMQLAKQGKNPRVRILKSEEEVKTFFDQWHADHPAPADAASTAVEPKPDEAKASPAPENAASKEAAPPKIDTP